MTDPGACAAAVGCGAMMNCQCDAAGTCIGGGT
jgi:hypothetical protein